MDTQPDMIDYHSDVQIGSLFPICSPVGNISITLPPYLLITDSDQAERR